MKKIAFFICLLFPLTLLADDRQNDPWEGWNRSVHAFNETLDTYVARPLAKGYRWVLPTFVRNGVGNVFSNLNEVPNAVNGLLQAKPGDSLRASGRFLINSTVGIFGLFDVAGKWGLESRTEDLGQTLAVWGVGSGPYMVLPVLGPSTLRDALSLYPNDKLHPLEYAELSDEEAYTIMAVNLVHRRYKLLGQDELARGDKYIFYRDAYLQNREYEIKDGQVEDRFDAGFDDFDFDEDF